MKRLILFGIWISLASILHAQTQQFEITGKVVNLQRQPVEFMHVVLMKSESSIYTFSVTDSLGEFRLVADEGTYVLRIGQFGQEFYLQPFVLQKDTLLVPIEVSESVALGGVAIQSNKNLVERKADRLVFNVENSASAVGGTALDALKATPLVRIQNETVSIVGKGEVLVMVDERPQRLSAEELTNLLKTIPADNIKSIEVITTPPAKYDAEGNGGLINIKLKTAKPNTWNANLGATYTQRTHAGGNVSGAFTYNRKRLSLQASVNIGTQDWLTTSDQRTFYPNETWKQTVINKSTERNLGLNLGTDYKIYKNWMTGVRYQGSFTDNHSHNNPFTERTNVNSGENGSFISSAVNSGNKAEMHAVNWFNTFHLDSSAILTTDFDYFNNKNSDRRSFSGSELDKNRIELPASYFSSTNANLNSTENYSVKADVEMPRKWASLTFGGKFSYTRTDNDLELVDYKTGTAVYDTNQANIFRYKEFNEAMYFSADKKIGDKWEIQAGLRIEATQTEGYSQNLDQTNRNNYLKFFPTAYLSYSPTDNHSISLSYSRRIRRPGFDYMNPFTVRSSPYYYSEGNPFLKPSVIDNLEISYIFRQNWVSSIYACHVSDFSQSIPILDEQTNVTRTVPLNYANEHQIGFSTSYHFNKWFWWDSFTGFNVNYQNVRSKIAEVASVDGFNGYIYSNNDFAANKDKTVMFSLNYGLQLPGRYQIFNISTIHILDLGIKFLFLNKSLTLGLAAQDVLNAQRPLIAYQTNGVKADIKDYNDTRSFRISVSYRFGDQSLGAKQRIFGNEEERGRMKM